MSFTFDETGGVPLRLWVPPEEVEAAAMTQLVKTARLPRVYHHVAAMADVHAGIGATVGSVIAQDGAVSPAAVGVDIGCGMVAAPTALLAGDLPDNLEGLRAKIEAAVPVGFAAHADPLVQAGRLDFDLIAPVVDERKARCQLGTLGGGNHFIELSLDSTDRVWIVIHSGSRNAGNMLAKYHMERAAKLGHNEALEDKDLAYFLANTAEMNAYMHDLRWAQDYAALNRQAMMAEVRGVLRHEFFFTGRVPVWFDRSGSDVNCHHNYVAEERHFGKSVLVTRKGAISARLGERGVIPGSMGAATYVVEGLGNPDSFCSASHGAGRRMSRTAARKRFTAEDLAAQTAGVCCRKDAGIVDEIPGAYKDIGEVMERQSDLVRVVAKLKAVLCVKG